MQWETTRLSTPTHEQQLHYLAKQPTLFWAHHCRRTINIKQFVQWQISFSQRGEVFASSYFMQILLLKFKRDPATAVTKKGKTREQQALFLAHQVSKRALRKQSCVCFKVKKLT